jgi:uncharacterized membrane protein (DUF2068 family)
MGSLSAPPAHAPGALDDRSSDAGLRAVASFEAFKGVAVILLGILLIVVHHRVEDFAEDLLDWLHVDADRRFGHMVLNAATKVSDARLWTIIGASLTYSGVRFIEAWGLWHRRVWAEWFALLSGALYLPLEIFKVSERATWERVAVLVINLVIVLYMLVIRLRAMRRNGAVGAS